MYSNDIINICIYDVIDVIKYEVKYYFTIDEPNWPPPHTHEKKNKENKRISDA